MAGSNVISAKFVRPARGVTAQPASRPIIEAVSVPGEQGALGPGGSVGTVNGQTGNVILTSVDVGLGHVANLAPADLPVSIAQAQADAAVQSAAANDATAKASAAQGAAIAAAATDASTKANAAQDAAIASAATDATSKANAAQAAAISAAATDATAKANARAAAGANSDITSLSGLTTPLSKAQGGLSNTTGDASGLSVIATGASVARTHAARAADIINVKDLAAGAGQGNAAADTAAILAALAKAAASPGSTIYLPAGTWAFNATVGGAPLIAVPSNTTVRGDGQAKTVLTWTDSDGFRLFGSAGTSASRATDIVVENLTVRGSWAANGNASAYPFLFYYVDGLSLRNVTSEYSRVMGIVGRNCTDVSVDNCVVRYTGRDGINMAQCSNVSIRDNDVSHTDDDSIAIHSDIYDPQKVRGRIVVTGNRVFEAQGISVLSARQTTISGNTLDAVRCYGINLGATLPNTGTEGLSSGVAVTISGNTITNILNRSPNIDSVNTGAIGIAVSGRYARAGTATAIPGEASTSTGTVIDPYPETFANSTSASTPTGGNFAINITGNTIARTLPACNGSDSRYTKWSDFGLGKILTRTGWIDPVLSESDMRDAGVVIGGGIVRDVLISSNIFRGLDGGLKISSGARADNIVFRGNQVVDGYSYGVQVNTTGALRLYVDDNIFDLDPYLKHTARALSGKWASANGPVGIQSISGSGVVVRRNTFRNMAQDSNIDPGTPSAGWWFDRNVVEADGTVFGSFSSTNKGVGLIHSNHGMQYARTDSDPASSTFGTILAMPTTPSNTLVGRSTSGAGSTETISVGSGLALSNGTLSVSLPSPIQASGIAALGGVTSAAPPASNAPGYLIAAGGSQGSASWPTIAIAAPPAQGGTQATAVVTSVKLFGTAATFTSGGSGYVVGDLLTVAGGITEAGQSTPRIQVTSIGAGGSVTGISGSLSGGLTSVPTSPISFTGGSGTGVAISGITWTPRTVTVTAGGSGYSSPPTVTFSAASVGLLIGSSTVNSAFTATGGSGQIILDNTASKIGASGTTGSPVMTLGALIDGSGVRMALTGSAYSVPANTSLVRFTQTGTVASQTITLPTPLADGQPIQFVNQGAGAVTALTFSPAVQGWTNGSQLSAGPGVGIRIRWDATASAWYREQ
jgi:hypothetical protein